MTVTEEAWGEPKVWRLGELIAIRNRMHPPPRWNTFSNNNGIQGFKLVAHDGRVREWTRIDPSHLGTGAGFVETTVGS